MAAATYHSKDVEKAIRLYSSALDLADEQKSDKLAKSSLTNLASLYVISGKKQIPHDLLLRIELSARKDTLYGYHTLVDVQLLKNHMDSARHYLKLAETHTTDIRDMANLYYTAYRIEAQSKNFEKATENIHRYIYLTDSLTRSNMQFSAGMVEREYFQEQSAFAEYRMKNRTILEISSIIIVILLSGIAWYIIRQRMRLQRERTDRYLLLVEEANSEYKALTERMEGQRNTENHLKGLIASRFNIIDKLGKTYYERENTSSQQAAMFQEVPLIFIIFPQTEGLAYRLLGYIWNPIRGIFVGIIDYIPKLFTIIVIWYAVKYLVRFVLHQAREVEGGRLKINGFYPDWAMPTFHIIRFLLYAFMIAMIYPYLPGSNSGVFQGISVFVGLIVSLGSSTVIGNIIAGLVITYMRPFKIGDRIQLNDTTGNIIEKTPLVTRIRTPKNEVVTVPNSFVMSSHTVNYSTSAREYGLIIHSEVSIGYDIPWRKVNELLIDAALNTPGVVDDPRPFVLETSLSDWYPVYQVNAYIKEADKMPQIYSNLHQNIQDKFNEAGIEIMSPHYMAMRDGNETTIPKDDLRNTSPTDKTAQESKPK